jgi:hypothetical protein
MVFDFSFWDLALWFGTTALTTLVASELLSPHFGRKTMLDIKKLRVVAAIFSVAFIFTVGIRIISFSPS